MQPCLLLSLLLVWADFMLQWQSWTVGTETIWLIQPETFTIWLLIESLPTCVLEKKRKKEKIWISFACFSCAGWYFPNMPLIIVSAADACLAISIYLSISNIYGRMLSWLPETLWSSSERDLLQNGAKQDLWAGSTGPWPLITPTPGSHRETLKLHPGLWHHSFFRLKAIFNY